MVQKLSVFVIVLGFMLLGYAGDDVGASNVGASNELSTEPANLLTTTTQQTDTSYPVVDTGQAACYNDEGVEITCPADGEAFYGQDAQFADTPADYTDNGDGTVTDNVTGLVWQQTPPTTRYNWPDAADYCSSLTLGGYTDWQLPSAKALFSTSDFSSGWPYLNTTFFDLSGGSVSKDEQFWSSNYYLAAATPAMEDTAFGINHGTGHIKAYPALVGGGPGLKTVRCVRGGDGLANDFVDNEDGTITDNATGLMWMQDDSGKVLDWENALAHADGFSFAGYDDWRVPNIKELQSIIDYSGTYPAIDQTYFNVTDKDSYFWSSTSAYFSPNTPAYYYAWYVAFGYAVGADGNDSHGAGAVRFDTKVEGGPAGEEPERIYNYVRLVRDADQDPGSSYTVYLPFVAKKDPAAAGVTYPIVDTGQTTCYDDSGVISCPAEGEAFYGQDAQFTGNTPSYTDNGDGTVTDNVTGLVWQQSADTDGDGDIDAADKMSYEAAGTYCENLTYAGYEDWQLPTIKQLYSLIDFSGFDPSGYEGTDTSGLIPFIDTEAFDFAYGDADANERIIDSQYASSNLYVGDMPLLFGVNFADGRIKGYGLTLFGQSKTFAVACVRENSDYGVNDFGDNGDGTITDNATDLMWAQDDSGSDAPDGLNWEEALAYVEAQNDANYLGYSDWRLPNVKELQSIVDYARSPDTTDSAAIDPLFNATAITNEAGQTDYGCYWSSTTHANWTDNPGNAGAYVSFGRAMGYMDGTWSDVHGAGAQRSDPKSGDPDDYPTGRGPQGDAIRIYNTVRLVRGGDVTETPDGDPTASSTETDVALADSASPAQPAGQAGPGGQPPNADGQQGGPGGRQMPDLTAAAAQLGVTVEALQAALGDPSQGPPDFAAAAQQLGVTESDLMAALGAPAGGPPPGGQPPTNSP